MDFGAGGAPDGFGGGAWAGFGAGGAPDGAGGEPGRGACDGADGAGAGGFGGDDEVGAPRPGASSPLLDWLADGDRAGGSGRVPGFTPGAAPDCPGG
jgi:hypothetical protein